MLDVLFLMDESGNIDPTEFALEKTFLKDVTRPLPLGASNTAAGIISWGATPRQIIGLTPNRASFENSINQMAHYGGNNTGITNVLTVATNHMEGAAGRPGAERVLVLIKDGPIVDYYPQMAARLDDLAARGYHIFPVGFPGADPLLQSLARNAGHYYTIAQATNLSTALGLLSSNLLAIPNVFIGHAVEIGWASQSNRNYRVEWAQEPHTNTWFILASPLSGSGSINRVYDSTATPKRFYRVIQFP